jgi:O-antigen ligase
MSLFFLTATGNLFINGGRTGQLAFLIGFLVLMFLYFRMNAKSFTASVGFLVLILLTAWSFSPNFHHKINQGFKELHDISKGDFKGSLGARASMAVVSFELIRRAPLSGYGVGNVRHAYLELTKEKPFQKYAYAMHIHPAHGPEHDHVHNQYLQTLVQGGLPALFLLLLFFYRFAREPMKNPEAHYLKIALVTIALVASFPEGFLYVNVSAAFFYFMTGVLLFYGRSASSEGFSSSSTA